MSSIPKAPAWATHADYRQKCWWSKTHYQRWDWMLDKSEHNIVKELWEDMGWVFERIKPISLENK